MNYCKRIVSRHKIIACENHAEHKALLYVYCEIYEMTWTFKPVSTGTKEFAQLMNCYFLFIPL